MKLVCFVKVYNEENTLREFIKENSFVDEFAFVDFNSTDKTVDVINEFPNTHVIQGKCINDSFVDYNAGLAVNEALAFAKTLNPDWLLYLDAYEIFEDKAKTEFRKLLEDKDADCFGFRLYTFWNGRTHYRIDHAWGNFPVNYLPKLFRNEPQMFFTDRKVAPGFIQGYKNFKESNLRIKHYSVENMDLARKKYLRYTKFNPGKDYSHVISEDGMILKQWSEYGQN